MSIDTQPKAARVSDEEIQALARINKILLGLTESERTRTLLWLNDRHGIERQPTLPNGEPYVSP